MTKRWGMIGCAALFGLIAASGQTRSHEERIDVSAAAPLIDSMEGPALYRAYCATCHGVDGKGLGPMTKWLTITAPDLTRIGVRSGGKFPLAKVQQIILGEQSITSGHGTREMPVWGPVFSQVSRDQDLGHMRVYNLAKYLESIQAK